jgi:uncharacterized protein YoaH (UPF0181 family)
VLACIERAESLALDLDPAVTYPEDWLIFRVTGLNGAAPQGTLVQGAELRAELSPFVERLCAGAALRAEEAEGEDAKSLAERWKVSRVTLDRMRKKGLVARRVVDGRKRASLRFAPAVVRRFEETNEAGLRRAGGFTRVNAEETSVIVERAKRLRAQGLTVNQAAAEIAREIGRSHEGVRQVLQRAAKAGSAELREAPALNARKRALLYRAWRRGVDLALLARRTRRSRGAVRRAINLERAARLRALLETGALNGPETKRGQAGAILATQPVRTGLSAASPAEVPAFLRAARKMGPPIGAEESARLAAYQLLRSEAARLIRRLDRLQPSPAGVDRAETMLRWAARLKAELVRSQFRLMLDTLAARVGRPVDELGAPGVVRVLTGAIAVIGEAVDAHDSAKGGRLAGAAGLALDRYAAQAARELAQPSQGPRRAVAVIPAGQPMPAWELHVAAWQTFLEPDARLLPAIRAGRVPAPEAAVLLKRYGWDGGPPRTLAELAPELKVSRIRVMEVERRALATALRVVRGGPAK